jgi:hypothetical protein
MEIFASNSWRKLRNEKLHSTFPSLNVDRAIKLRMIWDGWHVIIRNVCKILVDKSKSCGNVGVDNPLSKNEIFFWNIVVPDIAI